MRRAYNLATFVCRLSCNLGASTDWNPLGLSRPVMGLLYLIKVLDKCVDIDSDVYGNLITYNSRNKTETFYFLKC